MTWTRWKLLAGVLGVSVGGLAATCQEPSARKCHVPAEPVAAVAPVLPVVPAAAAVQAALPPPLPVAAPKPADAPTVTPVPLAAAAELPKLDVAPPPKPADPPKVELPKLEVAPPPVQPDPKPAAAEPPALPKLDLAPPVAVVAPIPGRPAPTIDPPAAKPVELPKLDLAPSKVVEPTPAADPLLALKPSDLPPDTAPPPAKVPARAVARPTQAAVPSLSSAVRVLVRIGEGRPNFDVLLGDDCLLKAVSDRVEVKAPGDKTPMSPLTASGGVRFTAPGCEGTCDTLTVLPATGEVELTGSVRVRCQRGKGETEFSGGTMRFKLGTAPAYTVGEPAGGTVPAAFTPASDR